MAGTVDALVSHTRVLESFKHNVCPRPAGMRAFCYAGGVLRTILVWTAIIAFASLGIVDMVQHNYRPGSASILLAVANLLLLT